jgi:hypothetical protein
LTGPSGRITCRRLRKFSTRSSESRRLAISHLAFRRSMVTRVWPVIASRLSLAGARSAANRSLYLLQQDGRVCHRLLDLLR